MEGWLEPEEGMQVMDTLLLDVEWTQPRIHLFGRQVHSPRLAAWYGDPGAVYRYSGMVNRPLPWTEVLSDLRVRLQDRLDQPFNSVLLNLYRDGNDAMGWHSDDEPELGEEPCIASVSLGASRRFCLRHRSDSAVSTMSLDLTHGSVLVMQGPTQHHWKHAVMRTRKQVRPRINLTYRHVG